MDFLDNNLDLDKDLNKDLIIQKIETLLTTDIVAIYELYQIAKNNNYKTFYHTKNKLKYLELLDNDFQIKNSVKAIVLKTVKVKGYEINLILEDTAYE